MKTVEYLNSEPQNPHHRNIKAINITNLCVFNDDQQIFSFMENVDVFKDVAINEDKHEKELWYETRANKENPMPKGMVSLDKLYDLQNHF